MLVAKLFQPLRASVCRGVRMVKLITLQNQAEDSSVPSLSLWRTQNVLEALILAYFSSLHFIFKGDLQDK